MRSWKWAAYVFLCATVSAAAVEDIVARRQSDMKEIAGAARSISNMFKQPDTYSSSVFASAADTIGARGGSKLSGSYDTLVEAMGSKASGEIAVDRLRFDKLSAELQRYAEALSTAAKNNPVSMDGMFMKVGEGMGGGPFGRGRSELSSNMSAEHSFHLMLQTCTACHQRFRTNSPYLDR